MSLPASLLDRGSCSPQLIQLLNRRRWRMRSLLSALGAINFTRKKSEGNRLADSGEEWEFARGTCHPMWTEQSTGTNKHARPDVSAPFRWLHFGIIRRWLHCAFTTVLEKDWRRIPTGGRQLHCTEVTPSFRRSSSKRSAALSQTLTLRACLSGCRLHSTISCNVNSPAHGGLA